METKLLRKEIHALSRKLKRMQITLQRIENIRNSPDVRIDSLTYQVIFKLIELIL